MEKQTDMGKLFDEQKNKKYPPVHDFDANPIVTGVLLGIKEVTIEGDARKCLEIKTASGIESVWGSVVIMSQLDNLKIAVGDSLGIRYEGVVKSTETKYKYKNFTLIKM